MYVLKSELEKYYVKVNSNGLFWVNSINANRYKFKIFAFITLNFNKYIRRFNRHRDYKWIIEEFKFE
jgi:hypothetical protein